MTRAIVAYFAFTIALTVTAQTNVHVTIAEVSMSPLPKLTPISLKDTRKQTLSGTAFGNTERPSATLTISYNVSVSSPRARQVWIAAWACWEDDKGARFWRQSQIDDPRGWTGGHNGDPEMWAKEVATSRRVRAVFQDIPRKCLSWEVYAFQNDPSGRFLTPLAQKSWRAPAVVGEIPEVPDNGTWMLLHGGYDRPIKR